MYPRLRRLFDANGFIKRKDGIFKAQVIANGRSQVLVL